MKPKGATQYYDADAYSYIDVDTANVGGLFLEGLSNSRTESGTGWVTAATGSTNCTW